MEYDEFERRHREREERRKERGHRRTRHRAQSRREEAPKEKVLHTRISEQLSEDIRKVADDLRVPVSNLVRNVLEEAFSVVETVSENVGDLLEDVLEEAEQVRRHYPWRRSWAGRAGQEGWAGRAEAPARDEPHEEAEDLADDDSSFAPVGEAEPLEREPAGSERETAAERPAFAEVLGWQAILLNRAAECADCGKSLERGRKAFVGITGSGPSSTLLCRHCTEGRG